MAINILTSIDKFRNIERPKDASIIENQRAGRALRMLGNAFMILILMLSSFSAVITSTAIPAYAEPIPPGDKLIAPFNSYVKIAYSSSNCSTTNTFGYLTPPDNAGGTKRQIGTTGETGLGKTVDFNYNSGYMTQGQELILYVTNYYCTFYTGPGNRNSADLKAHAKITKINDTVYRVGFEDTPEHYSCDHDYDDVVMDVYFIRPTASVSVAASSVAEPSVTAGTVTLDRAFNWPVTVTIAADGGTAEYGSDYTIGTAGSVDASTLTFDFAPGQTSKPFEIRVKDDHTYSSPNELFNVHVVSTSSNALANTALVPVTILEKDAAPSVSFNPASYGVDEPASGARVSVPFTVTLSEPCEFDTIVTIGTTAGSATAGTDYDASVASVRIPALASSATGSVTVIGDGLYSSPDKAFKIVITGVDHSLGVGTPNQATVTIRESTISGPVPPKVQFSQDAFSGDEPAKGATASVPFTLTLTEPCDFPVTVSVGTTPGTAIAGTDYVPTVTNVVIPARQASYSGSVTIIGDGLYSASNKNFNIVITGVDHSLGVGTPGQATVTIKESTVSGPVPPMVQLNKSAFQIDEPAAGVSVDVPFNVTLTEPCDFPVTVSMETVAGTAVAGEDYVATIPGIVIPAGQDSATGIVKVTGDGRYSPADQAFGIRIAGVDHSLGVGTPNEASVTIMEGGIVGPVAPTVRLGQNTYDIDEPAKGLTAGMPFTVTLTKACDFPVTVTFSASAGTAVAGKNYDPAISPVTIPAGQLSAPGTVTILGDGIYSSPNKTFSLQIATVDNSLSTSAPSQATVTIGEYYSSTDPIPPNVQLELSEYSADEPASGATVAVPFKVTLSHACDFDSEVIMSTVAGTAIAGTNYEAAIAKVIIPAGQSSAAGTVTVKGDGLFSSPNKTFGIRIDSVDHSLGIGTPRQATVTIKEYYTSTDPIPPIVRLNATSFSLDEPAVGTSVAVPFRVNLTQPCDFPVTVSFVTVAGTAVAGDDFDPTINPVTIPAGASSAEGIVTVKGDGRYSAADQSFLIQIAGATSLVGIGTPKEATVTIKESSTPGPISPTVQFDRNAYSVDEPAKDLKTNMPFTVTLSKPCDFPVTVTLKTVEGTAIAGKNYESAVAQVIIPAGASSAKGNVVIIGDGLYSLENRTFNLQIDSVDNSLCIGSPGFAVVTIKEYYTSTDPIPPTVQFNPAVYSVNEPAPGAVTDVPFTVTLSEACSFPVTVIIATIPDTAVPIEDYSAVITPVVIAPGQASGTGTVAVRGDGRYSPTDSSFKLRISSISPGPVIGTPREATVTILEESSGTAPTVHLSKSEYYVAEPTNSGLTVSVPFSVILSKQCDHPVTVNVAASDGTAKAGTDYDPVIAPVVIPAGETSADGSVTVIGDGLFSSPNKTFEIQITTGSPITAVDPSRATVMINETSRNGDEVPPTVQFSADTYTTNEPGAGLTSSVPFRITVTEPCDFPTAVQITTAPGTAAAGTDYDAAVADVVIPAGASYADGSVTIKNDYTYGTTDKAFTLQIAGVTTPLGIGTPPQATVTVANSDPKPVVKLNASAYDAPEGGIGYVNITLTGNASTPVTVYYTANGVPGTYTFDPAQDGHVLIQVPIAEIIGIQTGRTTGFTIDGVSDNAQIGQPSGATINIEELETTYTVQLKKGWNMISSPLVIRPFMVSELHTMNNAITRAMRYNTTTMKYDQYAYGAPSEYDFKFTNDMGYLVYCTADTSITFTGYKPVDRSAELKKSWNLVGWSTLEPSDAKTVTGMLPGFPKIMAYDATTQSYKSYAKGVPDTYNFAMGPGSGYLVYSDTITTLNYGGI